MIVLMYVCMYVCISMYVCMYVEWLDHENNHEDYGDAEKEEKA